MVTVQRLEVDTVEVNVSSLGPGDVFVNGHGDLCRFSSRERLPTSNGDAYLVTTSTGAGMWYALDARVDGVVLH